MIQQRKQIHNDYITSNDYKLSALTSHKIYFPFHLLIQRSRSQSQFSFKLFELIE